MIMEIVVSVVLLFVGIAALVLIHVCIVGRALGRRNQGVALINMVHHQRGNINNNNNINISTNIGNNKRMSIEDLKMIPCFDYVASSEKGTTSSLPVDCAVCLESFKSGDKCRLLPSCGHSFHTLCIDSWLLKSSICPICRTCAKIGVVLGEEKSELN